jgi:hypothetical protein
MSRIHGEPSKYGVVISGALGGELRRHAYERCRHFFLYLFIYKALLNYLNGPTYNAGLGPTALLEVKATDQIGTGFRSEEPEYYEFDATDPAVVNKSTTACGRMDAAHFCNLGIHPTYRSHIATLASNDAKVAWLYECLKRICGNTRDLPQRINIGPDKRIDTFHGDLATTILKSGKAVVSITHLKDYLQGAARSMTDYRNAQAAAGKLGVAACADSYLACYANDGESLWGEIRGNVEGDCSKSAYQLNVGDYLSYL